MRMNNLKSKNQVSLPGGWTLYEDKNSSTRVGYVGRELPQCGTVIFRVLEICQCFYLGDAQTLHSVKPSSMTPEQATEVRSPPPNDVLIAVDSYWNGDL